MLTLVPCYPDDDSLRALGPSQYYTSGGLGFVGPQSVACHSPQALLFSQNSNKEIIGETYTEYCKSSLPQVCGCVETWGIVIDSYLRATTGTHWHIPFRTLWSLYSIV